MFERLSRAGEGALVPFAVLGDPDAKRSLDFVRTLVAAGADALELGLPFSDPIADGPVIQAAATRALSAGIRRADAWRIVRAIREEHRDLPIGLLVYANLVLHRDPAMFYAEAAEAGVDSVLIADLPVAHATLVVRDAKAHGVATVFIAPPNADRRRLEAIAAATEAYTYVTSREGVTGADASMSEQRGSVIATLEELGAPPALIGFGISNPSQVRRAIAAGAAGAVCGSAIVGAASNGGDAAGLVRRLKEATRG